MRRPLRTALLALAAFGLATACIPIARPGAWHQQGLLTSVSHVEALVALPDGRAFVIGDGLAAVYNPAAGAWSAATSPPESLVAPAVVALPDGRVLVFGGRTAADQANGQAWLYSPTRDRWERTGALTTPRDGAAATLLSDGRVLAAGGVGAGNAGLTSAEIFEPSSGRWTATGSMAAPRYDPSVAVAGDGRVVVINGWRVYDPANRFGGNFPVSDVEAFDPRSGRWSALPKLPLDLVQVRFLTLKDGRLIGLGGVDPQPFRLSAVQVFDPATDSWRQLAPMTGSSGNVEAVTLDDGRVLVIRGGQATFNAGFRIATAGGEVYDPDADLWLPITNLPRFSALKFVRLAGGSVLAVGFRTGSGSADPGSENGLTTAVWDPGGYPQLPGAEGPLASGSVAAGAAVAVVILTLVLLGARLRSRR